MLEIFRNVAKICLDRPCIRVSKRKGDQSIPTLGNEMLYNQIPPLQTILLISTNPSE